MSFILKSICLLSRASTQAKKIKKVMYMSRTEAAAVTVGKCARLVHVSWADHDNLL